MDTPGAEQLLGGSLLISEARVRSHHLRGGEKLLRRFSVATGVLQHPGEARAQSENVRRRRGDVLERQTKQP